jgi:signal transduction histidine kinase/DNA-binding response OmpR family regulator
MKIFFLILFLFISNISTAQLQGQARVDSLIKELPNVKKDTSRVLLLKDISSAYRGINPEQGIKYGNLQLELSKQMKWEVGKGLAWRLLGENYLFSGDNIKALEMMLEALNTFENVKDTPNTASCLSALANIYIRDKNYEKGLELSKKAMALARSKGLLILQGLDLGCMGICYEHLNELDKALENYEQAIDILSTQGDKRNVGVFSSSLGHVYRAKKEYSKALSSFFKSMEIAGEFGNLNGMAANSEGAGLVYLQIAMDTTGSIRSDSLVIPGRSLNVKKAITYFSKAIGLGEKLGDFSLLADVYENLSEAYVISGQFEKALASYKQSIVMKDSVFSADNNMKFAHLETQRETMLKDKQIKINEILTAKERNERLLFFFGITVFVILIILQRRNHVVQKRTNARLVVANKELEEEKNKTDHLLQQKGELMNQLETAANMKSKFLANVSHELRTPVTLISGILGLIKEQSVADQEKNKVRLAIAYENSRKLQKMVEEILDITRAENNVVRNAPRIVEFNPLLGRIAHTFDSFIKKGNQSLIYENSVPANMCINIDEDNFEKIINNIIYNAFKFNSDGGWIKVTGKSSADKNNIIIAISDAGKGISDKDLPHIFERFYRMTGNGNEGGIGIGLSLVKELTDLSGGTVEVVSKEGEGATFTLSFPVSAIGLDLVAAEEETNGVITENWNVFPHKQTVLIVEDNADMRYYLKEIFHGLATVAEAGNGVEAIKWLENNRADLVITDLMMPEMNGREFVDQLRTQEGKSKIPIIMVSAIADTGSQLDMLRMGVDDYIVKPFNAQELRIRVYNLLNNYSERIKFNQLPSEKEDIQKNTKEAAEFMNRITEFVVKRLDKIDVSVNDVANEFALSERQFYRFTRSLTGFTPAQLIKEIKLQKAYQLLAGGKINKIEDVATQVGFETPAYFAKQFFERFGKRPNEFY